MGTVIYGVDASGRVVTIRLGSDGSLTVGASALPDGAATETTLTEVRDRLPANVSSAVPSALADGMRVRPVPSGAQAITGSTSIVFATDHPPVNANLMISDVEAGPENPVPISGFTPRRTANGAIAAASSGLVVAGPADLLKLKIHYEGSGNIYLLLFDSPDLATVSNARIVLGSGYPFSNTSRDLILEFLYPLSFSTGIFWAASSTSSTYTASAQTFVVAGQWR